MNWPYREIWLVDFEFIALPGERPSPVCLCALELRTGRLVRQWRDEFGRTPPYSITPTRCSSPTSLAPSWVAISRSAGRSRSACSTLYRIQGPHQWSADAQRFKPGGGARLFWARQHRRA